MKKRPAPPAYVALRRRLVLPMVALWLALLILVTCISARSFYLNLQGNATEYLTIPFGGYEEAPTVAKLNLVKHAYSLITIDRFNPLMLRQRPTSMSSTDWYWGKWDLVLGYRYDMCWYDENGEVEIPPGYYLFTAGYDQDIPEDQRVSFYIDLNRDETLLQWAKSMSEFDVYGSLWTFSPEGYKLTGRLDGDQYYVNSFFRSVYEPVGLYGEKYTYEEVVRAGNPTSVGTCQTIEGVNLSTSHHDTYGPFRHNGVTYQSAGDLLNTKIGNEYGLFSAVIIIRRANVMGGSVAMAIHCRPIVYTALRLIPFYLISGIALWIALALILRSIRNKLILPLGLILRAYDQNRTTLGYDWNPWAEIQTLGQHFDRTQQERRDAQNEVQRLSASLEHAQNAESHRRQTVSAIAHELKTPLAIIHSYAEGLQSGIAGEKQDHYLQVILEETERMDGLVLQMLDLSRLEAGKVRLSTDTVAPAKLIREAFDRLSSAAEAKELQITLELADGITVTADEARLEQVIRNFAHNAVRYTHPGGNVRVVLEKGHRGHIFTFQNDCPPLSEEALERVFDSFYRADDQPGGTGLGLAICKSIITLHGGTCTVRNTQTGVQFQFWLPN